MRPIKLTMQAFGSYKDKTVIDFARYDKAEVFLITGETGSGKTTIFDAICFALYSEASCVQPSDSNVNGKSEPGIKQNNDRDRKNLVTDYPLKNKTNSVVELIFSHNGKVYTVTRVLYYSNKDSLRCDADDMTVETQKAVNDEIKKILGINVFQFKQIAMIAQGEFKKLITAPTSEREPILRMLFGTEAYDNMGKKLNQKTGALKTQYEDAENEANRYYNDCDCGMENLSLAQKAERLDEFIREKDAELKSKKEACEEQKKISENKRDIYNEVHAVNVLYAELDKLENAKKALEERKPEIEALEARLLKYDKAVSKIKDVYAGLKNEKDAFSAANKAIKELGGQQTQNEEKRKKLKDDIDKIPSMEAEEKSKRTAAGIIENDLPKYKQREDLAKQMQEAHKAAEAAGKTAEKLAEEKTALKAQIREKQQLTEELKDIPTLLGEKSRELSECKTLKESAKKLADDAKEYDKLSEEARVLRDAAAGKLEEYGKAKDEYDYYEKRFDAARLGILAAELKDGVPCPLCGSTHHPRPAELSLKDENLSENELKRLKKLMEGAEAAKTKAATEFERKSSEADTKKKALERDLGEMGLVFDENYLANANDKKSECDNNYKRAEDECESLEKQNKMFDRAREELKKLSEKEQPLDEKIKKAEEEKTEKNNAYIKAQSEYQALEGLKFNSCADAEKEMKTLNKQADEVSKRIDDIRKSEKSLSDEASRISGRLEEQKKAAQRAEENIEIYSLRFKEGLSDCGIADEAEYLEIIGIDVEKEKAKREEYNKKTAENIGGIKNVTEQINGRQRKDETKAKADYEAAQKMYEDLSGDAEKLDRILENHRNYRQKAASAAEKYGKYYAKYLVYSKLNDIISAKIKGKNKLSFESYMQRASFEKVLDAANRRLESMSGKRLVLKLHDIDIKGEGTKNSLDLDVTDNYTGKSRPASTLSGGESFITSLSLALGLSDMVTGENGGVNIDALFIDEGFGNLDSTTIQRAIDAVFSLQKENKLVGVISHREELITAIETCIEVWKDADGSHLVQK